ncbi:TIGR02646 family protein [Serratia marcescens]|nr:MULTISPECIES: retron system putative HNH endonuclease [Serratia]EMD6649035.1 TIGR02646 family protein [Serratia marcescens]MBD8461522.1 TIGR02646 family protein [Serratia marcescens]MCK1090510.1 TIGR02646 family protein [Serratia marcescens]MCT4804515.1 TIGR02646 family protein [Serratia marcescens]MDH2251048.1 TIGR02646 family protein [Serratia marcescens]
MKHLHRVHPGPDVLRKYDCKTQTWDDVSSSDKKAIWVELVKMQGKVCAYCERKIDLHKEGDKHIEHFKRKGSHKGLTFDWGNLFGSCGEKKRCGFYKDKQEYNESDLLKADVLDPNDFFLFIYSGDVVVKPGVNAQSKKIAEVTLSVFNLNPKYGGVKAERRSALEKGMSAMMGYIKIAQELIESGGDVDGVSQYVRDCYYEHIEKMDFISARKHVFDAFLP